MQTKHTLRLALLEQVQCRVLVSLMRAMITYYSLGNDTSSLNSQFVDGISKFYTTYYGNTNRLHIQQALLRSNRSMQHHILKELVAIQMDGE
jgi:hypothetical protein